MSDYDAQEKKNKEENKKYLNLFRTWLIENGLAMKTINNHVANVDLYINDFLCYTDLQKWRQDVSVLAIL